VAAEQVSAVVELIQKELVDLETELEYHKTRYFAGWRWPNTARTVRHLVRHREQLRTRRDLLITILGVQTGNPVVLKRRR
jgi:hypothetical protein